MNHDHNNLTDIPADAQLYLRPVHFSDGPFADPATSRALAGGLAWFGAVQLIIRHNCTRSHSVVITFEALNVILMKLNDPLRLRADMLLQALLMPRQPLRLGNRMIPMSKPQTMGILNLTPDSFSQDGIANDPQSAISAAYSLAAHGAAIVDVGAESTRPGAKPVWEGDEIARLEPVLKGLAHSGELAMSLDTRKASVMKHGMVQGVPMINDISALTHDSESLSTVAASNAYIVLMHSAGDPQTMQDAPHYDDALLDVFDYLEARVAACVTAGIDKSRILVDPGIGFGKTLRHNLDLINGIGIFHGLGCPIVLGVSRKKMIGALSREESVDNRLAGGLTLGLHGIAQGVQILRTHDVAETVQMIKVWTGLRDAALTPPVDTH